MIDPNDILRTIAYYWPNVVLYDRQIEIIDSTFRNHETYVPAANKMGKDFIAGLIAPATFLYCIERDISCRIVTTSIAEHHLKVVWGEIGRFLTTAQVPLLWTPDNTNAPLTVNYQEIRRANERDAKNPTNYVVGRVSAKGEGLAGHHAQFTMLIGDESSGLDDEVYKMGQGWAKRMLFISNCNPNPGFFYRNVEAGDMLIPDEPTIVSRV